MRKITAFVLSLTLVVCLSFALCGCSDTHEPAAEDEPVKGFSEVYNDGITVVEAGRLVRLPGSSDGYEYCFLELKITNCGTKPMYYSSMLCLTAGTDSELFPTENILDATLAARAAIDGFSTLDGVIDPDATVQGFAVFEAPVNADCFDINLAADFTNDEWISFSCSVQ